MEYFYSGLISGIFQTIIGHPLDTLKTIKQNNSNNNLKNSKNIYLYAGLKYPLIQNSIVCSTSFYTNYTLHKSFDNIYFSSFVTGIISSIIICPLDEYKIKSQQNIIFKVNKKTLLKSYKNFHILMLREIPANIIYFSSYEYLKNNNLSFFISGSIAGVLSWLITHPIDTIKTRLQSGSSKNIKEAVLQKNLLIGIKYSILRAFIVNGFGLYTYELSLSLIKNNFH